MEINNPENDFKLKDLNVMKRQPDLSATTSPQKSEVDNLNKKDINSPTRKNVLIFTESVDETDGLTESQYENLEKQFNSRPQERRQSTSQMFMQVQTPTYMNDPFLNDMAGNETVSVAPSVRSKASVAFGLKGLVKNTQMKFMKGMMEQSGSS